MILIPKLRSEASSYSAATSFTYNYQGYDYQFYFSGLVSSPEGYYFDSSAIEYLLQTSAEGINISISSGLGAKINNIFNSTLTTVFNLYRNFMIATDKLIVDWIVWDDIYGFEFQFTGLDPDYPGHETYGSAYGWRFSGWMGEDIDLVLDSQGMLYGSNPIGNYTFSDDQREFGIWSIHQFDDGDDEFWVPEVHVSSFGDLKPPYFEGNTLVFFAYNDGVELRCTIPNFERCLCVYQPWNTSGQSTYPGYLGFIDYQANGSISNSNRLYIDGTLSSLGKSGRKVTFTYKGLYQYQKYMILYNFNNWQLDVNLPMYQPSSYQATNFNTITNGNVKGILSSQPQYATCELLYLDILTTTPLPDPIVLPVDDPIPVSNIDPDPVDFDPDPDDDPDPVPGIQYPGDDPLPWPVPDIPPIVSGNDDIWPDLNLTFGLEDGLLDLTGNLSNFEWPTFSGLIDNFTNALVWVSSIMTLMYSGTEFSVLFNILAVFFIAAAILGLYKWWNK